MLSVDDNLFSRSASSNEPLILWVFITLWIFDTGVLWAAAHFTNKVSVDSFGWAVGGAFSINLLLGGFVWIAVLLDSTLWIVPATPLFLLGGYLYHKSAPDRKISGQRV
jgi:hypothetical protein